MLNQVKSTVAVFVLLHLSEHVMLLLLGTDPGRQRVAHEEDREVGLFDEGLVLSVGHRDHESVLVHRVSYCKLGITR